MFFLSSITLVAQTSTVEVAIKPAAGKRVSVTGYDGFRADTLASITLDSSGQGRITIPYRGFILLVMENGRIFPLILDKKKTRLVVEDYAKTPEFRKDEENTFFYQMLISSQKILGKKQAINEGFRFFQKDDPYRPALDEQMDTLTKRKARYEKIAGERKEGLAGVLLQSKLLIESTSGITTREQLDDRKMAILRFIRSHSDKLKHTDMLRQLAFQYEMMNEYIAWGQYPYEQVMVDDVGTWIDSLGLQLGKREIVRYFLEFYLGRSMVSMAIKVADQHLPWSLCPVVKEGGTDTIADVEVKISDSRLVAGSLKKISAFKILFLYDSGCPACIAEQVSLMRILKQERLPVPMITLFSAADEEKGLSILTRLQRETFLYAVSDRVIKSTGVDYFPAFLVVSGDQKIMNRFYTMEDLRKWIATVTKTSR